eukprot:8527420-Heterocapsa_arctica.AAC.1
MGIGQQKHVRSVLRKLKISLKLRFCANDKRSARNVMEIARTPEDRSKTIKNLQKPLKPYAP